jgi:hypothetical protein
MNKLGLVVVVLVSFTAAGCDKGKGGGADCAKAIDHSMELSKAEMAKMGNDDKMMQKMKDLGLQHCKDDKWSADVIKCMVEAKAMADAQACYGKLTREQQDKMNKAAMELAMPAGAGEGTAAAGSAAGDTGSAAAGNAMAEGSAAAGSATGSAAAGSAAGSATGSAK